MYRFAWKSVRRSSSFWVSCLLLSALMSSVPAAVSNLNTSKYATSQSIYQYGRGSYDILVRNGDSKTAFEQQEKLVEENFLTGGKGGITLEQYETVRGIQEVEVAAPVAVLGFFANTTGSIQFDIPKPKDHSELNTMSMGMQTGLPFTYNDKDVYHILTVPEKTTDFYSDRSMDLDTSDRSFFKVSMLTPLFFNYIVGVDVDEERKLLGVGQDVLPSLPNQLKMVTAQTGPTSNTVVPELNLLTNADFNSSVEVKIERRDPKMTNQEIEKRFIDSPQVWKMQDLFQDKLSTKPIQEYNLRFDNNYKPFGKVAIAIDSQGKPTSQSDSVAGGYLVTSTYHLAGRFDYEKNNGTGADYALIPYQKGDQSKYREITQVGEPDRTKGGKLRFVPVINGSFKAGSIVSRSLDPSPLGIYAFSPVTRIKDELGQPDSSTLKPDFTPNTFLPIQAAALTNIQAAKYLKGDAPIDAIRVRVAGISGYDETSEAKILDIAKRIEKSTGLQADIVAGASKQNVTVAIPAVTGKPAIGTVSEVWTTLGVAKSITSAVNKVALLITVGLMLITFTYTIVHTQSLFIIRKKELDLLRALGWTSRHVRNMIFAEWFIKSVLSAIIALVILLGLSLGFDIAIQWGITLLFQAGFFVLLFVSIWWAISRSETNELKLGKEAEWSRNTTKPTSIFAMIRGNLRAQLRYIAWNLLLIVMSGSMALFSVNLVFANQKQIGTTFLGAQVNAASNSSLWLVVIATLFMVAFGLWQSGEALLVKRSREIKILGMIGWEKSSVARMIMGEIGIVFALGSVFMILLGMGLFRLFYETFPYSWLVQVGIAIGYMIMLLSLSAVQVDLRMRKI